ncbi:MAG: NADH-quinone oxidoreductase subunit C [Alcanivoracaceae bacterium]|nr:NADH-quinone oxidoreductase subunit C [Alcanivoracaceae bacterium]
MNNNKVSLEKKLKSHFGDLVTSIVSQHGEITCEVIPENWQQVCQQLRDDAQFSFAQLIDLCGIDYLGFGESEWQTEGVTNTGFSRGIKSKGPGRFSWEERKTELMDRRYAVVIHLLSIEHNMRIRVKCFAPDTGILAVPSLVKIWAGVDWFEREAFDLFGIIFVGHPDLRRILTDYGFVGHPFRKDFPLIGNVEVRYDEEKGRVVYEPVSIEPRVTIPKTIRKDARYAENQEQLEEDS